MRQIYKYPIFAIGDGARPILKVGKNPHILKFAADPAGIPCLWVEHEVDEPGEVTLSLYVAGTGRDLPERDEQKEYWLYIDSAFTGPFVWHLYEISQYEDAPPILRNL